MVFVSVARMTFATNHFNLNQKVWLIQSTGAQAAYVCGRHRGSKRYVKAWIRWGAAGRVRPDFKRIEVAKEFADRQGITIEV